MVGRSPEGLVHGYDARLGAMVPNELGRGEICRFAGPGPDVDDALHVRREQTLAGAPGLRLRMLQKKDRRVTGTSASV